MANRWLPDTCGCELSIDDYSNIEGTGKFIIRCKYHTQDTLMTVVSENFGRSRVITQLLKLGLGIEQIRTEFEKKGRGRRHARITVPVGTPDVTIDSQDVGYIRILRR